MSSKKSIEETKDKRFPNPEHQTKTRKNKEEYSILDKYYEHLELIQEKTGFQGKYVVIVLISAMFFVFIGFLERPITNLVGTAYPVYWTMKAIESKSNEDKQWLTYWVVFACFTIIDMFSGYFLKLIPFYFFLKIIFLIWLFMPNSQGSYLIYHLLVVRVFRLYEQDIDKATEKLTEITKNIVNTGQDVIKTGKDKLIEKAVKSPFVQEAVKDVVTSSKIKAKKKI